MVIGQFRDVVGAGRYLYPRMDLEGFWVVTLCSRVPLDELRHYLRVFRYDGIMLVSHGMKVPELHVIPL